MLYPFYALQQQAFAPIHAASRQVHAWLGSPYAALLPPSVKNALTVQSRLVGYGTRERNKPEWDVSPLDTPNGQIEINDWVVYEDAFAELRCFSPAAAPAAPLDQPPILLVAAMSGHYATLLRDMVRYFAPTRTVYVTDWKNARDIPLEAGEFGVEAYISFVLAAIDAIDQPADIAAICQPCPLVLAALAVREQLLAPPNMPDMPEDLPPAIELKPGLRPRTLTLIGGPVDPTCAATKVTETARNNDMDFFRNALIDAVSPRYKGKGRMVYPGYLQLSGFMSLQPRRHMRAYSTWVSDLWQQNDQGIEKFETFYDEYFAVMDLHARFFLETVEWIFKENRLVHGTLSWRGMPIDLKAITETALLTIEGARDDISAPGQTEAAHALCPNVARHCHYLHPNVGHYGLFSGSRFRTEIAPEIVNFLDAPQNPHSRDRLTP